MYNIKYKEISSYFLIVFSGFYLTRIMSFSPIYGMFMISFLVFVVGNLFHVNQRISKYSLVPIVYILYLIVTQPLRDPDLSSLGSVILSLLYYILAVNTFEKISQEKLLNYTKKFLVFSLLLLSIEAIYRITHPVFVLVEGGKDYRDMKGMLFYAYKYSSIMFLDSNFVGTYALICYFLSLFLYRNHFLAGKFYLYAFFIVIVFTFSRAAIITVPLTLVLLKIFDSKHSFSMKLFPILIGIAGVVGAFYVVHNDPSFMTKFEIIETLFRFLLESSVIDLFFGLGFGNTSLVYGRGAHNLIVTHVIESGILGFTLFMMTNFSLFRKSHKRILYVITPLFISGMSLAGHAIPYYYSCLVIITVLSKNDGKNIDTDTNV